MKEENRTTEVAAEEKVMDLQIEGLTEEEIKNVQEIFQRFIKKYEEDTDRETGEWLYEQLKEELPEKEEEELQAIADEIIQAIEAYDKDLEDLNASCKKGITKESWFAEKLQDGAKGVAVDQFGEYLREVDKNFAMSNMQMARTVLRADGGINESMNLDGFIAEQYHVNSFNAKAVLEQSPYRARVCVPDGQYAKNSVDVMIDNIVTGQKGVARYQLKYGSDSQTTINMLKNGNYPNQRLVVPSEQVEEVQRQFPGKTVTDYIGGTEDIPVSSDGLTKEQVKKIQKEVQADGVIPKQDWNSYQTKDLALNIGKQAGQAGIQAAFLGAGIHLVRKAVSGEPIDADETIETALTTGADTGIKAAAGGALKVASEKHLISLLPPGTPAGTIAKIACVGVENVKILWKVAKGELTMSEAMEHMGRTSVSMYAGLSAGAIGAGIGAAALSWVPIVGPIIGGVAGGMVGYAAGSKFGEKVFNGAKKVAGTAVKVVKRAVEGIKSVASKVWDTVTSWIPW